MALLKVIAERHNTHKSCESVRGLTSTGYEDFYVCELFKVTRSTIKWRDKTHAKDYFCHEIKYTSYQSRTWKQVSHHACLACLRLGHVKTCLGCSKIEEYSDNKTSNCYVLGIPWGFAISWATRERYEQPGELAGRQDKWCEEERGSWIPWGCGRRDQVEQG